VDRLNHHEITLLFFSLGVLLFVARAFGEVVRRFNQPAIFGELLAGVVLGPSVLGAIKPEWADFFFPHQGGRAYAMDTIMAVSVVMFLLVAGLEVDLSSIGRQGKIAALVSIAGIAFPFALGFNLALAYPGVMGSEPGADRIIFALFFGVALSITAMPVIARTLMDLNLYRSDLGMLVMVAAAFNDLAGWIVFSIILSMMDLGNGGFGAGEKIIGTLLFVGLMLTVGRMAIHHSLPWIKAHTKWPVGLIGFCFALAFLGAALTDYIGIHAIFGAFIVGVALGDSRHLSEHARETINQLVTSVFAPIFFASIGLRVNFVANFDFLLCAVVFVTACAGKVLGCAYPALWAGTPKREAWAVGVCMNARGVMEIILGLLALQYGLISERLFVALTVMALGTSMLVGPLVQRILRRKKPLQFTDFLRPRAFIASLAAADRTAAIGELSAAACMSSNIDLPLVESAVLAREETMPTGIGNGLAIPHARLDNLDQPILAVGISESGVDFDAPDGRPAHLIFLLLTPTQTDGAQMEILADIARTFKNQKTVEASIPLANYTEFLAFLNSQRAAAAAS
jgi:Kef-type K+ transport system membrane component KefB/mannitol/fructose-specific phosphotransferase system IIA component (Ntr-type)